MLGSPYFLSQRGSVEEIIGDLRVGRKEMTVSRLTLTCLEKPKWLWSRLLFVCGEGEINLTFLQAAVMDEDALQDCVVTFATCLPFCSCMYWKEREI